MRVNVDREICNGYGNCVVAAPDVFGIDRQSNIAFVLVDDVPGDQEAAVSEAVDDCPARAISVERG